MPSETSLCRHRLKKYCIGYGIDIGFGGDKIVPAATGIDFPTPYTKVGSDPVNLGGNAMDLYWFRDGVLDYVYSSHLLEDFPPDLTENVLKEWLRVLKIGGYLILYLPDEQKYRAHCKKTGQPYNAAHKVENFNLDYIKSILEKIGGVLIVHENPSCEAYSFEIVGRKIQHSKIDNSYYLSLDSAKSQMYLKELEVMKNSRSWRYTKPMRTLLRYIREIFHKN